MKMDLHASLQAHNTFGFEVKAHQLAHIEQIDDIPEFANLAKQSSSWRLLGGGSNVVLTSDLPGVTGIMAIQGKSLVQSTAEYDLIEAYAGENWHEFVTWTLEQGYPGLENLALIPGTVGAAPIQNIGAYGLELADVFDHVTAWDLELSAWVQLDRSACQFSYRHSIFKDHPQRYIVSSVTFRLKKPWVPNLRYEPLASALNGLEITPNAIYDAVCAIRNAKLPNPKVLGNAGSFFHNPVVTEEVLQRIRAKYPGVVTYPYGSGYKLAAGWLIDQCGLKGYQQGSVGVYDRQALILVNHGQGSGKDILELAKLIEEKVYQQFGVRLSREPVVYP
jgi:UDP-N-acetylmuramate dehydrogenase